MTKAGPASMATTTCNLGNVALSIKACKKMSGYERIQIYNHYMYISVYYMYEHVHVH